ncbi:MAG: hypothetical protein HKN19_05345 [Halioglobus sp.]|nr:hypothetical protein [Halioglobus sp.]
MAELRRVAIGVTGLLLLVLVWGGARVLFLSAPEPHLPAESSLRVAKIEGANAQEAIPQDLTTRPLFWHGRQPYQPPAVSAQASDQPEEVLEMEIDAVQLVGVLGAGDESGIIVTHAGSSRRLALDDEIEGWRFTGLSDEGAKFTSSGRTRLLTMEHAAVTAPQKKKDRSAADKSDRKAGKKSREEVRAETRAQQAERRKQASRKGSRRTARMTSVWGGPPKQAEPEKPAEDQAEEQ